VSRAPVYNPVRTLYFTEQGLERYRAMLQKAKREHDHAIAHGDTDRAERVATSVFHACAALAGLGGYVTADLNDSDLYCVQTDGPLHYGVNVSSHDGTWSVNS
jgi:hypothetical protein